VTAPLPAFRIVRPRDVTSAVAARREHAGSCYLAGGTDLVVNIRHGLHRPELLIDLAGIDELAGVEVSNAGVRIGAGATLSTLADMPLLIGRYRAVAEAAAAVAGPGHRAMGTLGGNLCLDTRCIYYNQSEWWRSANNYCLKRNGDVCHVAPQGQRCHAAFSGDLAPALMVLGAEIEIAGYDGRRRIPLVDLYADDGRAHLALAADELVVAVHMPPDPPPSRYAKARARGAIDFPLAGVAVALAAKNGRVLSLRVGLTGTNPRPFLVEGTAGFIDRTLDDETLRGLEKLVQKQVQPMRTTIASAHYRRLVAAALTRRLATDLYSRSETFS
jgi:4-hydroxybenzoyl-CoA reductase subunit beta